MPNKEKPMVLSASQLQSFIRSPLNWIMEKVERLEEKKTKSSHKGRNLGCLFEDWIRHFSTDDFPEPVFNPETSSQKDFWSIEREAKAVVFNQEELYSHDWEWQHSFNKVIIDGLPAFRGFIDMVRFDDECFHIIDVKRTTKIPPTTKQEGSGFDKRTVNVPERFYGMTEESLKTNLQAAIYSLYCARYMDRKQGTMGHSQGIVVRDKGREIAFETGMPIIVVDPAQLELYKKLITDTVNDMIKFKKDYTLNGLDATIQSMKDKAGTDDLKEIIPYKLFARVNPYWGLFTGKKTFDNYTRRGQSSSQQ